MSVIGATSFMPEATTRMSTPPWAATAVAMMASPSASVFGRLEVGTAVMPDASSSRVNALNSPAFPAAIVSRAPAAPSVAHTTLPNAPVAPTITADLPSTANKTFGSMRGRVTQGPWDEA